MSQAKQADQKTRLTEFGEEPRTPRQAKKRRITFRMQAPPGCKVHVAGSFSNWAPANKQLRDPDGDGNYSRIVLLPPGRHEYKFIVNGTHETCQPTRGG